MKRANSRAARPVAAGRRTATSVAGDRRAATSAGVNRAAKSVGADRDVAAASIRGPATADGSRPSAALVRKDGRAAASLRPVRLVRSCLRWTAGSALIRAGSTQVLCAATIDEKAPPFLRGTGRGWITAEYGMLPGSTSERSIRNKISGRSMEIQRLIGRALRAAVDLNALGERTITLDCDVLEADGGTRTAAITAAYVALREAIDRLRREKKIAGDPVTDSVAAVSVGRVGGSFLVDLCHEEDSGAEVDFNLVATGSGRLVEIQGTAERGTYSEEDLREMIRLGLTATRRLTELQLRCLAAAPRPPGVLLPGRGPARGSA